MEHTIAYGSSSLAFDLAFADRKTLGITVHPDRQVDVIAPLGTELQEVYARVRKRAAWIVKQQRFFLGFEPRTPPRRYVSGETHLYLGRKYRLRIVFAKEDSIKLTRGYFTVSTMAKSKSERSEIARLLLDEWYRRKANSHFPRFAAPYLRRFARLGATPTDFLLRNMEKRWGSCTASGRLILNPELIRAPRGCIEYVIVHELCHLIHHDHGKQFQALQAQEFPSWEKWKKVLEEKMV